MVSPLFHENDLRQILEARAQQLRQEINSLGEDRVLNTSVENLVNYFVEKYILQTPEIDESGIQIAYGDTNIDVSRRQDYFVSDPARPYLVTGTKITFHLPIAGDSQLFKSAPSQRYVAPVPKARIGTDELTFVYERTSNDSQRIPDDFQRDLQSVKDTLVWMSNDLSRFNTSLPERARREVEARREKLLRDRELVENLGFPLRRRQDTPATFAAPQVKRRITPQLPPMSTEPFKPEPVLETDHYEFILTVLSNMVTVMEQSPRAFKGMNEEDLRTHFLVHLNGHYEGQATGETFNYEGKTDILIKAEGRNLFIAECKVWAGPVALTKALNQLLGYTTWRDTKTALLIFNRGRNMSTVLEKVPEVVKTHQRYKSEKPYESETGFRYIFGHQDDPNRELVLTILVFDIPR